MGEVLAVGAFRVVAVLHAAMTVAQAFAAGALLAMITDTMLPEAYDVVELNTGSLVAIGFAISLMLSAL